MSWRVRSRDRKVSLDTIWASQTTHIHLYPSRRMLRFSVSELATTRAPADSIVAAIRSWRRETAPPPSQSLIEIRRLAPRSARTDRVPGIDRVARLCGSGAALARWLLG